MNIILNITLNDEQTNAVTIRATNATLFAIDLASATYRATVIQH